MDSVLTIIRTIESWSYPVVYLALFIYCIVAVKHPSGLFFAIAFGIQFFISLCWRFVELLHIYQKFDRIYNVMNQINFVCFLGFAALIIIGLVKLSDSAGRQNLRSESNPSPEIWRC